MNRLFKAGKLHYKKLVEFLMLNISRTMPMLQGIDFKGDSLVDGYNFYIYGKEINKGIEVEGLICISPSNTMYIYMEDKSVFDKLDFFKLVKEKMPKSIKAEESTAKYMLRLLSTMNIGYEYGALELMQFIPDDKGLSENKPGEAEDKPEEKFQIFEEGEGSSIDEILPIVNKAQKYFGRNNYSKSDLHTTIAPRLRLGDIVICKSMDGEIVAQGSIEFEKCGISMLGNIFTLESARGQGAGNFVVEKLIKRACSIFTIPFLFVESNNYGAKKLYETLGMKPIKSWLEIKPDKNISIYHGEKREA